MTVDYLTVFLIGFFGGFSHCIGMCGGFVMTYTLRIQENEAIVKASWWKKLQPHLLYNSGRVLTYTFLGEIFGMLGGTVGFILAFKHWQGGLEIFAGIIMLFMGLDLAGWIPSMEPDTFPGVRGFKNLITRMFHKVNSRNVFGLGVVLGFIPCGMVYAVGAKAAATESMLGGFMTMLFFGLGTFPAMVLTGLTAHLISAKLRRTLYKLAAVLVIVMAIMTVGRGMVAMGWIQPPWQMNHQMHQHMNH